MKRNADVQHNKKGGLTMTMSEQKFEDVQEIQRLFNSHAEILAELKECLSNMENDEFNTVMDSFEKSNDN